MSSAGGGDQSDVAEERLELGLQAERTLLAWTRTALSFVVAGALVLRTVVASDSDPAGVGTLVAVALIGTGGLGVAFGAIGVRRRLTRSSNNPAWALRGLAGGTAAMAVLALLVELVSGAR